MDLFTLTANKQSYTWGIDPAGILTADIALPRPIKINNIILQYTPSPNVVRQPPLQALNDQEWASKLVPGISAIPYEYYNDGANPLSTLYFFPMPNSAYTVELWTWQTATKFATIADEVVFPEGYEDFWHYLLASRLCGPFRKQFSESQNRELINATRRVSELNTAPGHIKYDPAITGSNKSGRFNYIKGPYR